MFLKYMFSNIKNSPFKYLLLVFCMIFVIVMAIAANAIYFDNAASKNNMKFRSRSFLFYLEKSENAVTAREKIFELVERSGLEPEYIRIAPAAPDDQRGEPDPETNFDYKAEKYRADNYGDVAFWWFPTYQDMVEEFSDAWNCGIEVFPTEEQYYNDKVIVLGSDPFTYYVPEKPLGVEGEYKYTDEDHVIIGSEEFLISGYYDGSMAFAFFPGIPENMLTMSIDLCFKEPLTLAQTKNVSEIFKELFGESIPLIYPPKTQDLLDMRKSVANIVLTVLVQMICVFNILIIYKYMVDSRKKQFAVMRLCGFKKFRCLLYSWGELALMTVVCLPAAFGLFELIKPELAKKYITVNLIFSPGYYLALGGIFIAIMTVAFAFYITPMFGKTVSRELREM